MALKQRGQDKDILLAAFETARAWSGLIVTLSTGAIVFTAVFRKDFAPKGQPLEIPGILLTAWILFGAAATIGVLLLGNLAALLNKGRVEDLDVYSGSTRLLAVSQWLSFIVGLVFLLVFFAKNLF